MVLSLDCLVLRWCGRAQRLLDVAAWHERIARRCAHACGGRRAHAGWAGACMQPQKQVLVPVGAAGSCSAARHGACMECTPPISPDSPALPPTLALPWASRAPRTATPGLWAWRAGRAGGEGGRGPRKQVARPQWQHKQAPCCVLHQAQQQRQRQQRSAPLTSTSMAPALSRYFLNVSFWLSTPAMMAARTWRWCGCGCKGNGAAGLCQVGSVHGACAARSCNSMAACSHGPG